MTTTSRTSPMPCLLTVLFTLVTSQVALADRCDASDDDETPFGAAVVIIELTDNDIELQVFADAFDWNRLQVFDPGERLIFDTRARGKLRRQGGLSELAFASEPSHYLVEEDNFDEPVEDFLARWPEGCYEFEGRRLGGFGPLDGEAYLSHDLAELPEVQLPGSLGTTTVIVDGEEEEFDLLPYDMPLEIRWNEITTQYMSDDPVDVFEYQVIVAQETPERAEPWIDGGTRRALINVPASICEIGNCGLEVPPEVLEPGATYEIEILAIETSGNASIGVLPFATTNAE